MDPIASGLVAVATIVSTQAVQEITKDTYRKLKEYIERKWGEGNDLTAALESIEAKPQSKGRIITLDEEVRKSGASSDPVVIRYIDDFQNSMNKDPKLEQLFKHIQMGASKGDIFIGNKIENSDNSQIGSNKWGQK